MKLLILAENLEINRTSSGLRSHKQLLAYSIICKNIDVLTATPTHLLHRIKRINYHFIEKDINKDLKWLNKIPKSVAIQNLLFGLDYSRYQKIKTWKLKTETLLNENKYELIISLGSGVSFAAAYALYYLKKTHKFKHLLFLHDPYPLNQYPPPYQKKDSLPYKSVASLFGKILSDADIVSYPSLRLKEWMLNYYPNIEKKSIIQPHIGIEIKKLYKYLPEKQINIPKFSNGLNIVHTGSLFGPRNAHFVIEALQKLFSTLPESKNRVQLHIMGKISNNWNIEQLKSDNVFIYPKRFTYLESLEIQQKADVLLIIEADTEDSPFMPGKLADYLMARKPILALTPLSSETSRILGKEYQLLSNNGNIEQIYSKLLLIYKHYLNGTLQKLNPSQESVNYVSLDRWLKFTDSSILI